MIRSIFKKLFVIGMLVLSFSGLSFAAEKGESVMVYTRSAGASVDDNRYDYHWRVFEAALVATKAKYGPYEFRTAGTMNEKREMTYIMSGEKINVMVTDPNHERDKNLRTVKISVDKGLVGYRIFLIHKDMQPVFNRVKTIDDLRKLSIGQGSLWSDVTILEKANFKVVKGSVYEGLFGMLVEKRFDAFSRGVNEAPAELADRKDKFPDMVIENSILLYYPMPNYFFFARTPEGEKLAKRAEEGLMMLVENGTLNKMFYAEYGKLISDTNLKKRKVFKIDNPMLPPNQPFSDTRLWYDPIVD